MGTNIEPTKGNITSKIVNITVQNTSHTKIDNDVADRIKKNIQRELTPVTTE